ncbi:MAG: hypothetical protein JNG88_04445 [Phycisphaerales bacterium]|nr:hypothetical protein [Phycisphaerales bacterium]
MVQHEVRLSAIPADLRDAFHEFVSATTKTAGANLLALVAYGGRCIGDPAYLDEPLDSLMVIHNEDLLMLERLGESGLRFGRRGIAAPLVMTPAYIAASLDSFPLEMLEIQQTGRLIFGQDFFDPLRFDHDDLRLQCERELKATKLHLRQGLLQAAGSKSAIDEACRAAAKRTVRALRGWLHIAGHAACDQLAATIITRSALALRLDLPALEQAVTLRRRLDSDGLAKLYAEIKRISDIVDQRAAGALET